jgi:ABC-type transporter Mla subunit MlaD
MTSLQEHLAVLSQAVPALPGKVEAVAHESDAVDRAAREVIAEFDQKRSQTDTLIDQVQHALEALHDHTGEESQNIEHAGQMLRDLTEREVHTLEEGADKLRQEGDDLGHAFEALQSELVQGGQRAQAVHEEARSALHGLAAHARSSQTELDGAVEQVRAALASAQQAVTDGQGQVAEGISALGETMRRLLGEALEQTRTQLDELHAEQERGVNDALSELEGQREKVQQELTHSVESDLEQLLDHELEGAAGAVADMGQQVLKLHAECMARREDLEQQFAALADRIPPLQAGVEQVKGAAAEVGLAWP